MHQYAFSARESATSESLLGGVVQTFQWQWQSQPITVVYEVLGEGQPILLLPAFSSVSTRGEMRGVAEQLAQHFQVVVPDWVGFGQSSRPALKYQPPLYHRFLSDFVRKVFSEPVVVMAAGHTAGYVMQLAQRQPCPWSWVVLIAPTWRGPLPTAMGAHRTLYALLRFIVRLPILGQFLYALNTTSIFLRWMYGRHVYADAKHLTRDRLRQKSRTAHQPGARFASVAFVTGALDPVGDRQQFFEYFQPLPVPVLMVIGESTPPKSLVEMEVLAHFSQVQSYRMPGALGLHEEYPDLMVDGILSFLKKYLS